MWRGQVWIILTAEAFCKALLSKKQFWFQFMSLVLNYLEKIISNVTEAQPRYGIFLIPLRLIGVDICCFSDRYELNEKQKYNSMAVPSLGSLTSLLIPVKSWSLHIPMVQKKQIRTKKWSNVSVVKTNRAWCLITLILAHTSLSAPLWWRSC